jgi:SnoaL-like polyketide cyclase
MSLEDNKRLARRALEEIYARGNVDLADDLVHPGFVDHEPAHGEGPTGPASVRRAVEDLRSAFSELSRAPADPQG